MRDEEKIYRRLIFHNFIERDNDIWFWAANYNALFRCPLEGGTAEKVLGIKPSGQAGESLYGKIIRYKNKIIAIPLFADQIMVYDLDKAQARFMDLNIEYWGTLRALERGKFWDAVVQGDYIYIIGFWSTLILKFNMNQEEIEGIVDLYKDLDIPMEQRYVCFKYALAVRDKIVIPSYILNQIFVLNTDDMEYERYVIKEISGGFSGIADDEENIWLTPYMEEPVVIINKRQKKIKLLDNYPMTYNTEASANISDIEYCNGRIWVMPYKADKVISIGRGENGIEMKSEDLINSYYERLDSHEEIMKYLFVQKNGNMLYSFCSENRKLLVYDTKDRTLRDCEYNISDKDYFESWFKKVRYTWERDNYLEYYISMLSDGSYGVYSENTIEEQRGKRIYHEIIAQ